MNLVPERNWGECNSISFVAVQVGNLFESDSIDSFNGFIEFMRIVENNNEP